MEYYNFLNIIPFKWRIFLFRVISDLKTRYEKLIWWFNFILKYVRIQIKESHGNILVRSKTEKRFYLKKKLILISSLRKLGKVISRFDLIKYLLKKNKELKKFDKYISDSSRILYNFYRLILVLVTHTLLKKQYKFFKIHLKFAIKI